MSWSDEVHFQCFLIMIFILKINPICELTVLVLYSKSGKNGKHSSVSESSNISAVSYMAVQNFEPMYARQFRSVPAGNLLNPPIFITFIIPSPDTPRLQGFLPATGLYS